jgi:hypothetical protein
MRDFALRHAHDLAGADQAISMTAACGPFAPCLTTNYTRLFSFYSLPRRLSIDIFPSPGTRI